MRHSSWRASRGPVAHPHQANTGGVEEPRPRTRRPLDRKEETEILVLIRAGAGRVFRLLAHLWTSVIVPLVVVAVNDPPDPVQAEESIGAVDQEEPEGDEPPRLPQLAPIEGLRVEYR